MLAASVLFWIPVIREFTLWFGAVDARMKNVKMLLEAGVNVELYPGGLDEMIQPAGDEKTINIKTRTGFLRLALTHGVSILPVFCFGETDLHDTYTPPGADWIKSFFRVGIVLPLGRLCSLLPYHSKPQVMVIGEAIKVKQCDLTAMTAEEADNKVKALQQEYIAALEKIWQENKGELGYEKHKLAIS